MKSLNFIALLLVASGIAIINGGSALAQKATTTRLQSSVFKSSSNLRIRISLKTAKSLLGVLIGKQKSMAKSLKPAAQFGYRPSSEMNARI